MFPVTWRPDRDLFLSPLHTSTRQTLRLDRFPAGVDHRHIDVALAPELQAATRALVRAALREEVHRNFWREPLKSEDREVEGEFAPNYLEASRATIYAARAEARIEKVQLFQIAFFRFLFECLDAEMARLRDELETAQARYSVHQSSRYLELQERLAVLVKARDSIRYRAGRRVVRVLARLERGPLRKMRKAVLGSSWPVPAEMLFNPLLQFGRHAGFTEYMQVYPPLFHELSAFVTVNRIVLELFAPWLPEALQPEGLAAPEHASSGSVASAIDDLRRRAELTLTAEERRLEVECWLGMPRNLLLVLGGNETTWPSAGPWCHPKWGRFQRRLMARFEGALEQRGLLQPALLAMRFSGFFRALGLGIHARKLFALTCQPPPRRELVARLSTLYGTRDAASLARRLEAEVRATRRLSRDERGPLLATFAQHYAVLRRDLRLALDMRNAMDELHLIEDSAERELSRSNGLLQSFDLTSVEDGGGERMVVGHVIIKADVRGSTAIIAGMRDKNQNPAAYFSRNLFDPITALLPEFSAEKVFVEGDAVILMIAERDNPTGVDQVVARACGLAGRILETVEQRNAESLRLGLPLLELGVGIAYVAEAPTYLYDHGHRIIISPAINRADRLSSCNRRLRALNSARSRRTRGVSVAARVGTELPRTIEEDDLARCNVNGVELDDQSFRRLSAELALREFQIPMPEDAPGTRYHIGQYADRSGRFHQVVVRDAIVPLWLGNQLVVREQLASRFYELITEEAQLEQLFDAVEDDLGESDLQLPPHRLP